MVVIDTEAGNVRSFLQQLHSEKTASIYTKIDCNNQKHARTHTDRRSLILAHNKRHATSNQGNHGKPLPIWCTIVMGCNGQIWADYKEDFLCQSNMAHTCLPRWLAVGTLIALVKIQGEVVFVPSKDSKGRLSHFAFGRCRRPRDPQVWRRSTDYWRVLGVEPGTSIKEVKRVYRQRAKKEHPDVNKSPDALQRWRRLSDAYGKLIDPNYRKEWEAQQVQSRQRSSTGSAGSRSSRSYGERGEDYNDYTSRTSSTSSRSPGSAFQEEARKWAGTGWEHFRDLLQRTDRFQSSSQSYVVREWKAAESELAKLKQELQKKRADEAKYLELTEQFKRRGQKTEELQAGRRTWVENG